MVGAGTQAKGSTELTSETGACRGQRWAIARRCVVAAWMRAAELSSALLCSALEDTVERDEAGWVSDEGVRYAR